MVKTYSRLLKIMILTIYVKVKVIEAAPLYSAYLPIVLILHNNIQQNSSQQNYRIDKFISKFCINSNKRNSPKNRRI